MKFSYSFAVSADEIDEQGHVNNVAYLRWIQDIAVAHWLDAATDEQKARYSWMVVRHEIDYKKQAFLNDEVTVSTWVGEWTTVKCERFTEIRRGEELLAKGRTVWCMVDRESLRPSRISRELIDRFI
jgi:acyl-CoA thioester hydrolase